MRQVFFLLLLLSVSQNGTAKSFSQAHTAFQRGDYAIALDMFRHLAGQGDGRAPLYLARLYEMNSVTIPRNWKKVFEWYHEAATVYESAESMYHLARLFEEGNGTPRDMQKAFFWYDQAAHKNDALAQDKVAHMYLYGIGVPQDETKAFFGKPKRRNRACRALFFIWRIFTNTVLRLLKTSKKAIASVKKPPAWDIARLNFKSPCSLWTEETVLMICVKRISGCICRHKVAMMPPEMPNNGCAAVLPSRTSPFCKPMLIASPI